MQDLLLSFDMDMKCYFIQSDVLSHVWSNFRRELDWQSDLLNTYRLVRTNNYKYIVIANSLTLQHARNYLALLSSPMSSASVLTTRTDYRRRLTELISRLADISHQPATFLHWAMSRDPHNSKFEVTLRLTVSQSVLWDLRLDITSCRNIAVWNLLSCFCGAPCLTREQVCNLQCNHWMVRATQNP
jgi:hypothetical protein